MKMKLKNILLGSTIGLSLLGCVSSPKSFLKEYGNKIIMRNEMPTIILSYDTENDGYGDVRHYYRIEEMDGGILYMKLWGIQVDKDKDHEFEENEFIWKR